MNSSQLSVPLEVAELTYVALSHVVEAIENDAATPQLAEHLRKVLRTYEGGRNYTLVQKNILPPVIHSFSVAQRRKFEQWLAAQGLPPIAPKADPKTEAFDFDRLNKELFGDDHA